MLPFDFLFKFNRNYASILYRFRDIASYLSTPVKFRGDLWHQKIRVPGLSCSVVCVIPRSAIVVKHHLVTDTDRQTDRQTQSHSIYRASIASRGNDLIMFHTAHCSRVETIDLAHSDTHKTICQQNFGR